MGNAKMKTNRAAAKRFKRTGSGKVRRHKAFTGHNFTCKSAKRKRKLRKAGLVAPADQTRAKRMLAGN